MPHGNGMPVAKSGGLNAANAPLQPRRPVRPRPESQRAQTPDLSAPAGLSGLFESTGRGAGALSREARRLLRALQSLAPRARSGRHRGTDSVHAVGNRYPRHSLAAATPPQRTRPTLSGTLSLGGSRASLRSDLGVSQRGAHRDAVAPGATCTGLALVQSGGASAAIVIAAARGCVVSDVVSVGGLREHGNTARAERRGSGEWSRS